MYFDNLFEGTLQPILEVGFTCHEEDYSACVNSGIMSSRRKKKKVLPQEITPSWCKPLICSHTLSQKLKFNSIHSLSLMRKSKVSITPLPKLYSIKQAT